MELGIWSHICSFFSFGGLRAASASDPLSRRLGYGFQRKQGKGPRLGALIWHHYFLMTVYILTKANGRAIEVSVPGWARGQRRVYILTKQ